MKAKHLVAIVAAVLLSCLLSFPCGAQSKAKPIELTYASQFPPRYGAEQCAMQWAEEIEKKTNGKVKFVFYHDGTLIPVGNTFDGVAKGIADIGNSTFSYNQGKFPVMEACDLPGYPITAIIPSLVAQDMYNKFRPKELDAVHVLYIYSHIPGCYHMATKEVNTLEDLKGLTIRAVGMGANTTKLLGGVPVSMPKSDQYDALQKGVVNGTLGGPNELVGRKVGEVTKTSTCVPGIGYVSAMYVVMNKKKWNSLPSDIQNIITEVSKRWALEAGKNWDEIDSEGVAYGKKINHKFIVPPATEAAKWVKALQPLETEYIKMAESKGLPGKEIMQYRKQLIEKYSKIYPPIKLD